MRDGRLELDDDGRVVDGTPPVDLAQDTGDVLEDSTASDAVTRTLALARRHPLAAGAVAVVLAAALVLGTVQALTPAPPTPLVATVRPVGLEQLTVPRAPLVGDYVLTTDAAVQGVGLVGPGLRASTAAVGTGGTLRVAAVPDCDDPASLDERAPAQYAVALESGGRSAVVPLPREVVDWSSALRRACWLQRTSEGLEVVDVTTRSDRLDRWLVLDLGLANRTGRPVQARSLDVADINAIEDADVTTVPDGGTARLQVRLPVTRCSAGALGAQTTVPWRVSLSVGPMATTPLAVVSLDLSRAQRALVAGAAAQRCGQAPDVRVRVLDAAPVPPSDVLTDTTAAGVDLRLAVNAGALVEEVTLGEAGRTFTADSRREFVSVVLGGDATTTLRWNARCASTAPPVLPVTVVRDGLTWSLTSVLDDPSVASARVTACSQRDRA